MLRKISLKFYLIFAFQVVFSSFCAEQADAQLPCKVENKAFSPDERLEYTVFYHLGFIWVEAGEVIFSAKEEIYNEQKALRLTAYGRSLENYDWIFTVRDKYEALVDSETLLPFRFDQNTHEDKYTSKQIYIYDYDKKKIYTHKESSKEETSRKVFEIDRCIHDLVSSMYYARNLDINSFEKNQKIPFEAIIDNEITTLYGRFLGKETLKLKDGTQYRCLKFSALVLEGSVFSGGENLVVWVSDDDNKIPVAVESDILVGSVRVYLRRTANLRNKQKALIR